MNCTIKGIVQRMDFEHNTLQNYLTLVLPTGEAIQCLVEDVVAERVIAAQMKTQDKPPTPTVSVLMDAVAGFDAPVVQPDPVIPWADTPGTPPDDAEVLEGEDDGVPSV
jgi:hypothetical protein